METKIEIEILQNHNASVQKICDICNYPRSTFYNYFDDIYDLMDYCWIAIMKDRKMFFCKGAAEQRGSVTDGRFSAWQC